MAVISAISDDVEFELSPGSWTSFAAYLDEHSDVQWQRGMGGDRKPVAGTCSFNLDNSTEIFTPANTSSAHWNRMWKGMRVRLSTTYSGTKRYFFAGEIDGFTGRFPVYGAAGLRVQFQLVGITAALADEASYTMALQNIAKVDAVLGAMMAALGSKYSGLYSFAASNVDIRWAFARSNALADLVAASRSDASQMLIEDMDGKIRTRSMLGGYASPAHTWGDGDYAPSGPVSPEYRDDSQFARQTLTAAVLSPATKDVVLYRHPFNADNGASEKLAGFGYRKIVGQFERVPYEVATKFAQTVSTFFLTPDVLRSGGLAGDTTLITTAPTYTPSTFRAGDELRIDNESIRVTNAQVIAYGQNLTVERGINGTVAASHSNNALIYVRAGQEVLADPEVGQPCSLTTSLTSTGTIVNVNYILTAGGAIQPGKDFKVENEVVRATAITVGTGRITVTRGMYGTSQTSHPQGAAVKVRTLLAGNDILGTSYVLSGDNASGRPTVPGIVGAELFPNAQHIRVDGRNFVAAIRNGVNSDRWLNDLVIGGKELVDNDNPITVSYQRAIPNIPAVQAAPAAEMPFGAHDLAVVKGTAMGLLMGQRRMNAWLKVPMEAMLTGNIVSALTAEQCDLVRYTGTGTQREGIDEFMRIVGVRGKLMANGLGNPAYEFLLAPAHLWRDPRKCLYTEFEWSDSETGNSLGVPSIEPVGGAGWLNDSGWSTLAAQGGQETPNQARHLGSGPSVGVYPVAADGTFIAWPKENVPANVSYAADTGGVGVKFRCNASETERWEFLWNRTQSQLILRNTTDGVVVRKTGYTATPSELEVRAQGQWIRCYVDCQPEPILSAVSPRFLTNTHIGPHHNRTYSGGGGADPYFTAFYGQGH